MTFAIISSSKSRAGMRLEEWRRAHKFWRAMRALELSPRQMGARRDRQRGVRRVRRAGLAPSGALWCARTTAS
jgi:hypothetical protein